MTYDQFELKAFEIDPRNKFGKCDRVVSCPRVIADFYKNHNPVDVEISLPDFGRVRFFAAADLDEIKLEYARFPNGIFIFASVNGDPIFIGKDFKVYTSYESRYLPEFISESFEDFLSMCVTEFSR